MARKKLAMLASRFLLLALLGERQPMKPPTRTHREGDDGADQADRPADAIDHTILPDHHVHLVARDIAAHIARVEMKPARTGG